VSLLARGIHYPLDKIILYRPPTWRKEWDAPARNPEPSAIARAVRDAKATGRFVVAIGNLEDDQEGLVDPTVLWDARVLHGELHYMEILALLSMCAGAIASPGFMVPAATSAGCPLLLVMGGCAPIECMVTPEMGAIGLEVIAPDPFCACYKRKHDCNKAIARDHLESVTTRWLDALL
jgi:hypothetical protein